MCTVYKYQQTFAVIVLPLSMKEIIDGYKNITVEIPRVQRQETSYIYEQC